MTSLLEPLPRPVFDRELGQISLREIFQKDEEGNYINFDATKVRDTCSMKYRIPIHQRYNKWNSEAKETIIESVFQSFIIGNLSLSRHSDGQMGFYFNIEDGQSRLTNIQEYLDDKFKFCGGFFSERTQLEQNRFLDYIFSTDTTSPHRTRAVTNTTIEDHYYENFDRINRGKALADNDKYWCLKNKPMVALAIELMEQCKVDYEFMKTAKFNTKDKDGKIQRKPLEEFVTMIDALLNGIYKKSYSRHYQKIGDEITTEDRAILNAFMTFYKAIYDTMITVMPKRDNEQFPFNNPGKFLSMVIMDFRTDVVGITLEQKKNMWVTILNIDRSSNNFMKGTGTLWNGFKDGEKKNQEQENINKRLTRVMEFYDDMESVSEEHNIEYEENDPED